MEEKLYELLIRPDYKSSWTIRYVGEYRTADRLRNHYKSEGYLTKIEKVKIGWS